MSTACGLGAARLRGYTPCMSKISPRSGFRPSALALALVIALAGCVATGPGGSSNGTEQLRASVDGPLRRAGLSQDCIDSLQLPALGQARGILNDRVNTSREVLQQRQRLRLIGETNCADM